jgi:hypothetical protein
MKYNIGDLILVTVSNRTYTSYITWTDEKNIELFHFDSYTTSVYYRDIVDRWISENNSKHYRVKDEK